MEKVEQVKKRITQVIIIFLSMMLAFVIISRSINELLLPVIAGQKPIYGRVETKRIVEGKIGLDTSLIKNKKIILKSEMAGKAADMKIEEGSKVRVGEELFKIEGEENDRDVQSQELERIEFVLKREELLRAIQKSQKKRAELEGDLQKERTEKLEETPPSEILDLNHQIDEQVKLVEVNEILYSEGLLEEILYQREKEKLNILKNKKEELYKNQIEKNNETIKGLEAQLDEIMLKEANLNDELTLNNKRIAFNQKSKGGQVVRSPIQGYVYTLNIGEGAQLEKSESLAALIPEGIPSHLHFEVSEDVAEDIEIAQEVTYFYNQIPKKAKVIKKIAGEDAGKVMIIGELDKEMSAALKIEYKSYKKVQIEIIKSSGPYPCIVSNSAINTEFGRSYVYTIEENNGTWGKTYKARKTEVVILDEGDYHSAVQGGIKKDDLVIKYPPGGLKDGQEIGLESGGS
jgi:biotin carboxyl carrier protein